MAVPDAGDNIDVSDFAAALDDHETRIGVVEPALSAVEALAAAINNALVGYLKSTDPFVQFIWKADTSFLSLDASGQATVTFGVPFPNSILKVTVSNGDASTAVFVVGIVSKSTSGFTVQCNTIDNTLGADPVDWVPLASTNVRVEWDAKGT